MYGSLGGGNRRGMSAHGAGTIDVRFLDCLARDDGRAEHSTNENEDDDHGDSEELLIDLLLFVQLGGALDNTKELRV